MRMTHKIKFFLILLLCIGLSACAINTPLTLQNTQGELLGNQLFIGKSFTLDAGKIIRGDIVGIGTDLTLKPGSLVEGDILLIGSSLEAGGIVKGDLNLFAGNSHLAKSAILEGSINQFFHHVVIDHDAQISGEINAFSFPGFPTEQISGVVSTAAQWFSPNRWFLWDFSRTLIISILTLLTAMLFKKPTMRVQSQINSQPIISWGAGIFIALATPIVALILIITICLLPIGFGLLIALALAYLFGWLAIGTAIGKLVQQWLRIQWSDEVQAFLGSLLFGLITAVIGWIPCIGWIFNFMVGCIGLGAVIITRFGAALSLERTIKTNPITPANEPPKISVIEPMINKPKNRKQKLK
jgi:hypothetical protein